MEKDEIGETLIERRLADQSGVETDLGFVNNLNEYLRLARGITAALEAAAGAGVLSEMAQTEQTAALCAIRLHIQDAELLCAAWWDDRRRALERS